jgi:hypothetical protein
LRDIAKASQANHDHRIDETADLIAASVESRMHGLIKAKVISPITGALVGAGVSSLVDWAKNFDWKKTSRINQANELNITVSKEKEIEEISQYYEEDDILQHEILEQNQSPINNSNQKLASLKMRDVERRLADQYPGLTESEQKSLAIEVYNLEKQWQQDPFSRPGIQLASSGGITSDVPLLTMPSSQSQAISIVMNKYSNATTLSVKNNNTLLQLDKSIEIDNELNNEIKHSKVMFGRRGNPAIDKFIRKVFSIFGEQYQKSLQETYRQKGISSLDLLESRSQEIDRNVLSIRQSQGNVVFKAAAEFNEVTGGTFRYLFDQVSHTAHVIDPGSKALVDATFGTVGHGVRELYLKLPAENRLYIENAYKEVMGHFPTENQKFALELPAGILLGQMTTSGISMAMVNRAAVSNVIPKKLNAPLAIENKARTKELRHPVLSNEFTKTFARGRYTARTLEKDVILYRAGSSRELIDPDKYLGQFFSKDKPISEIQVRIDKAILPKWPGGAISQIDMIFEVKVPAGTVVYSGKAGYQSGVFVGQTKQIVIPRELRKNLQILKTTPIKK